MSVLVSVIAIVGVIYFNYQDKKQAKKITHKYINKPFLTRREAALKKSPPHSLKGEFSLSPYCSNFGAKVRSFFV